MKTKTFGLAALTLGVVMLANTVMADPLSRTWNGRMQDDPANFSQATEHAAHKQMDEKVEASTGCPCCAQAATPMPCCEKMLKGKPSKQ